jgi:hypothetical protein
VDAQVALGHANLTPTIRYLNAIADKALALNEIPEVARVNSP